MPRPQAQVPRPQTTDIDDPEGVALTLIIRGWRCIGEGGDVQSDEDVYYLLQKQTDLEGMMYGTQDMQGWMQELNEEGVHNEFLMMGGAQ